MHICIISYLTLTKTNRRVEGIETDISVTVFKITTLAAIYFNNYPLRNHVYIKRRYYNRKRKLNRNYSGCTYCVVRRAE